jgi:ribosome recycling factor
MRVPWPGRKERQEAVRDAQREAEKSRRAARKARELAGELRQMEGDDLARGLLEGLLSEDGQGP